MMKMILTCLIIGIFLMITACEKLVKFHEFSPDAKACFEALRKQLGSS